MERKPRFVPKQFQKKAQSPPQQMVWRKKVDQEPDKKPYGTGVKEPEKPVVPVKKEVDINIKPVVTNQKLQNIVRDLYKGQGKPKQFGNGTTMDAVRHEFTSGEKTKGKLHTTKLTEYSSALQHRIDSGELSEHDESVAKAILADAKKALDETK